MYRILFKWWFKIENKQKDLYIWKRSITHQKHTHIYTQISMTENYSQISQVCLDYLKWCTGGIFVAEMRHGHRWKYRFYVRTRSYRSLDWFYRDLQFIDEWVTTSQSPVPNIEVMAQKAKDLTNLVHQSGRRGQLVGLQLPVLIQQKEFCALIGVVSPCR